MGKCKIKDEWLKRKDPNGYIIGSWAKKTGDYEIFCLVCETNLNVDHGFCRFTQHAIQKVHKYNCKNKLAPSQLHLESHPQNMVEENKDDSELKLPVENSSLMLTFASEKERTLKAELVWSIKCVISNYSLNSNKEMCETFTSMFGRLPINFRISSSKMMYLITEALGPYFWKKNIDDASGAFYSLCFDETTNESGWKELQTSIRFWSKFENKVVQNHLETFFMGHASAEELCENLLSALAKADLPLKYMLQISCDGPNVNKKLMKLMSENVLEVRSKSLIDIGTCSLHKVHNAFQKGLEEMGDDVIQLIISVYYYFKGWPARWEDLLKIQKETSVPSHKFIKHTSSRWLTLEPAASRIFEQWDAIVTYFTKFVPMHASSQMKTSSFSTIAKLLKKSDIKAQICFVIESAKFFSRFLRVFQHEEPMVHRLYAEEKELLLKIKGKLSTMSNEELDLLSMTEGTFSADLINELRNLKEVDQKYFLNGIKKFYNSSYKYLLKEFKCEKSDNILRDLECIQPEKFKMPASEPQIVKLGKALPFNLDVCQLLEEWKLLKFEDITFADSSSPSIDTYWAHVLKIKNSSNEIKFPTVAVVVKAMLSLSHGSASVEREFSISGNILTSDKASMNARGLNARLNILSGLRKYKMRPFLVPITKELILLGTNAHQSYKNYLEKEKEKEENQKKAAEEKIKLKAKAETAEELKDLSCNLLMKKSEENKKKKAADKLFEEATKRLESAVKRKNFEDIALAQGMLHGVKKLRSSEAETSTEISTLAKKIGKKSNNITDYFKKQTKSD